jgi:hypothetical protein
VRIVTAPNILVFLQIMTINISLHSPSGESPYDNCCAFSGCLSRQQKAVGMRRIGTKGTSYRVARGRERSMLSMPVVIE